MSLAPFVRTLGRGPGRSRSLSRDEAHDAMTLMLQGADPEAVGALLMLLRMKGETADEIAGFAEAAQASVPQAAAQVDLDWPSYAAGRTRGLPWFLLSARLIAQTGARVMLHGWNGSDPKIRAGVQEMAIPVAETTAQADLAIATQGICYRPLEGMAPDLFALLSLRDVLGLRSCVNTVCRMLNPGRAAASVQGVFHPSYRLLQADAAARLGWTALSVIKGGGGEFEVNPSKDIAGFGLRAGAAWTGCERAQVGEPRRLAEAGEMSELTAVWTGQQSNAFAEAVVLSTTALALDTLGETDPHTRAKALWRERGDLPCQAA